MRLYLDNDEAGSAATLNLFEHTAARAKLVDMRGHYAGYEDLNAWLLGEQR